MLHTHAKKYLEKVFRRNGQIPKFHFATNTLLPVTDFTANGVVVKPVAKKPRSDGAEAGEGGASASGCSQQVGRHAAGKKKARQQERGDKAASGVQTILHVVVARFSFRAFDSNVLDS
jgi:hypothetical protein